MTQHQTDANERLEQKAAELDPALRADEKARQLREELAAQVEQTEAREAETFDSAAHAPAEAGEGVAEHEREMLRRGFEKAGPPQ